MRGKGEKEERENNRRKGRRKNEWKVKSLRGNRWQL